MLLELLELLSQLPLQVAQKLQLRVLAFRKNQMRSLLDQERYQVGPTFEPLDHRTLD